MDLQNLFKQFSNFNMPNMANNESNNASQNEFCMYPESFNTSDFNQNSVSNMSYNQNNNNNNNNKKSQNPLGNLFGQNSNISSLLGLLPLLKGKQNMGSLLSGDNLPDNLKSFAPFISMLSNTSEKKSEKEEQKIDNYKKIEE